MIQMALIFATMLGWIPFLMGVFASIPARRAVIFGFVLAWLYLPNVAFGLPGLPDYSKVTATTAGAILGSLVFDSGRFFRLRFRLGDLAIMSWCLSSMMASVTNGLGVYDGASSMLGTITLWGLPYLLGRLYFSDPEGLRELAQGIVLGAMSYIPLCLLEIRLSPFLGGLVYGISSWEGTRYGGFRPKVFLNTGLELGMWMTAASLVATWLWWNRAARAAFGVPSGFALAGLLVTTVLCKSTGALGLLLGGLGTLWFCRATKWTGLAWLLLLTPLLYCGLRGTGVWSGRQLVTIAATLTNEERAQSFEFRIINEDILVTKALQQPIFGWGGYGRARVYDSGGTDISITDGYWIIVLGNTGLFGLGSLLALLLLPAALFFKHFPARRWREPELAAPAAFAVLLILYMLDNISNAMLNPIYCLFAGGLMGMPHFPSRGSAAAAAAGARRVEAVPRIQDDREILARNEQRIGREMKRRGRYPDADRAWSRALQLWGTLSGEDPTNPELADALADLRNDLAWMLTIHGNSPDMIRGDDLAELAVAHAPDRGTYWNTLAATRYRVGDFRGCLEASDRAAHLIGAATGFDDLIRALAHHHLGQDAEAHRRYESASAWIARNNPRHPDLIRLRTEVEQALGMRARR